VRLIGERRGGLTTLAALAMPALIGLGAFAVDLGAIHMRNRQLQGMADAAALAAAGDPTQAQALAQASVTAAGWPDAVQVRVETGGYAPDAAIGNRFTTGGADAVRVTLDADTPVFLGMAMLEGGRVALQRKATAARARMAAFSVGSRLASLDGGIANALLSGLTGSTVSLSLMDHQALLDTDVDLFRFSDALRTRLNLTAASYDDVLAADIDTVDMLQALADALTADGRTGAASVVRTLAGQIVAADLPLDRLIDLGPLGAGTTPPNGFGVKVTAASLIDAALGLSTGNRQVEVDLGAGVPGVAKTRAWIAIGDRPVGSPWVAVSGTGNPTLRTAQTRIYLETEVAIAGLSALAKVRLPILIELAQAEARLKSIDCASVAARSATVEAKPSPAMLAITEIDKTRLTDHSRDIATGPARLVQTLLVRVDASARVDLGGASGWQNVKFTQAEVDAAQVKSVSTQDLTQSAVASLISGIQLTPVVLGILPIPVGPIISALGQQLGAVAPALDGLVNRLTGVAGVKIGEADVRVTGLRCGQPALVA
jgi:uncharacterized membrane protein